MNEFELAHRILDGAKGEEGIKINLDYEGIEIGDRVQHCLGSLRPGTVIMKVMMTDPETFLPVAAVAVHWDGFSAPIPCPVDMLVKIEE